MHRTITTIRRPYAIKNHRRARNDLSVISFQSKDPTDCNLLELVLDGIRELAPSLS